MPPLELLLPVGATAGAEAGAEDELSGLPIAAGGELTELVLWVLNVSSRTRPAAVLTIARMTRRMVPFRIDQNSNVSWWMFRRGTPAARNSRSRASVIPGGPQM